MCRSGLQLFVSSRIALLLIFVVSLPAAATDVDQALLDNLRAGGYNIYFRHVATDWSQTDQVYKAKDWLSCDTSRMRQLSAAGRADARQIGKAIRELKIPVGEVLASPYCRTVETARLMELGIVEPSVAVMNLRVAQYFGGRAAITASARVLLATPPPSGTNRIIVAHGNVAREATPAYPDEGEALVFLPDGQSGFYLVVRIKPSAWERLVERYPD